MTNDQSARRIDDSKHQDRVPVYLTEREMLDVTKGAIRMDKKAGEFIRYAVRVYLYGSVGISGCDCNEIDRHE